MIFKRLEFGLLVRFILLLVMMFLTVRYLVQYTWLQITSGILVMLAQVWELAVYVTRSNNKLAKFLQAVKQRDFSQRFNEHTTNSSLKQLHIAFNLINNTYKQLHTEKEAQFLYMQTILQLIDTGIVAVDEESGEVEWVNDAFKKLLGVPYSKSSNTLPSALRGTAKYKSRRKQASEIKIAYRTIAVITYSYVFLCAAALSALSRLKKCKCHRRCNRN
ncbi:PAS domain-containing protein [Pontibacter silvestris]|uniref:PAS domain-containing protein n=1 Tax=Pontibacter silvestris TaxID=2305183 RepID=A0ABW4WZG0_9BACT|nr:PAS domain-containing protein [Pontibacter silvestris]MCC9136788.1 PAS domain-containing protein [Pontibacter silvestris]